MELQIIKLSLERVLEKLNLLEKQNSKLKKRIKQLEQNKNEVQINSKSETEEDTLIDTKEVLEILGICFNTLRTMVKKKIFVPIRINQRRVRYSKKAIYDYIHSQSN